MSSRVKKPAAQANKPQAAITTTHAWSGPLPPPEALARFQQIVPNGAERILHMAEQEQLHRISTEQMAQQAGIRNAQATLEANIKNSEQSLAQTKRGQVAGTLVSISAIVSAVVSAYLNAHPAVSVALVGVPILGIVKALIGTKQDK